MDNDNAVAAPAPAPVAAKPGNPKRRRALSALAAIVVVAGGPRLGDARAGGGAELVGLQGASVTGGLAVVGTIAVVAATARRFRAYDARDAAQEQASV